MTTINMHMKFESEIPKQTWLMLRKPWPPSTCIWNLKVKFQSRLDLCSGNHVVYRQTDGGTDGRRDGRTDGRTRWIQYTPPPTLLGGVPFCKWCHWKSLGFCLWPPSTCIWNLKVKFQSKLDLCSGNHVVYRQMDGWTDGQTDGRTRWIQYTLLQFHWAGYKDRDIDFLVMSSFSKAQGAIEREKGMIHWHWSKFVMRHETCSTCST